MDQFTEADLPKPVEAAKSDEGLSGGEIAIIVIFTIIGFCLIVGGAFYYKKKIAA